MKSGEPKKESRWLKKFRKRSFYLSLALIFLGTPVAKAYEYFYLKNSLDPKNPGVGDEIREINLRHSASLEKIQEKYPEEAFLKICSEQTPQELKILENKVYWGEKEIGTFLSPTKKQNDLENPISKKDYSILSLNTQSKTPEINFDKKQIILLQELREDQDWFEKMRNEGYFVFFFPTSLTKNPERFLEGLGVLIPSDLFFEPEFKAAILRDTALDEGKGRTNCFYTVFLTINEKDGEEIVVVNTRLNPISNPLHRQRAFQKILTMLNESKSFIGCGDLQTTGVYRKNGKPDKTQFLPNLANLFPGTNLTKREMSLLNPPEYPEKVLVPSSATHSHGKLVVEPVIDGCFTSENFDCPKPLVGGDYKYSDHFPISTDCKKN